jgi:hypothetical protein
MRAEVFTPGRGPHAPRRLYTLCKRSVGSVKRRQETGSIGNPGAANPGGDLPGGSRRDA